MEELEFDVDIDAGGAGEEFEDYEDLYEDVNVGFFPPQEAAPVPAEQEQVGASAETDWQEEENGKPTESQELARLNPGAGARPSRVSDPRLEQQQRKDSAPVTGESPGPAVESTPPQQQQSPVVNSRPQGEGKLGVVISELHWWTTDADLEGALAEYGRHKGLKFSEERASGRSKGFCQIEFYEAASAQVCKEKLHGRAFHGRPCVVQYATQQLLKQMNNMKPQALPGQQQHLQTAPKKSSGGRGEGGGRGYGGGKPGLGIGGGRGPGRGRGGRGGNSEQFGHMTPGQMGMYDPAFGPPLRPGMYGMGYMRPYPMPFAPGVAPHVNPAFFGRGANGHMMGNPAWGNGGGWGGEESERGGGGYGGGGAYDDEEGDEGGKGDGGGGGGESRKRSKDEREGDWDRERQHKEKERDMDSRERDHRGWEKDRSYKSRDRRHDEDYEDDYKKRRH